MIKRNIRYIVVHSTLTAQDASIRPMINEWRQKKEDAPYHYLIDRNGTVVQGLFENNIANNDTPHNEECIHVAYIGGVDKEGKPKDTRTAAQEEALYDKLVALSNKYQQAAIVGKSDLCQSDSPCFNVKKWLGEYVPDLSEEEFTDETDFLEAA